MPPKEVRQLREYLDSLEVMGERLKAFKDLPVMSRAFFPGGYGLFQEHVAVFPFGETFIVGSNFGLYSKFICEESGNICLHSNDDEIEENQTETWKNLLPLLRDARIIPEK